MGHPSQMKHPSHDRTPPTGEVIAEAKAFLDRYYWEPLSIEAGTRMHEMARRIRAASTYASGSAPAYQDALYELWAIERLPQHARLALLDHLHAWLDRGGPSARDPGFRPPEGFSAQAESDLFGEPVYGADLVIDEDVDVTRGETTSSSPDREQRKRDPPLGAGSKRGLH